MTRTIARQRLARIASGAGALLGLHAAAHAQFSGPYAPPNWTLDLHGGDGSVVTSGAPAEITLIGNDNGQPLINTDYTVPAAAAGLWSFDWQIIPHDTGTYDSAYYLLNGTQHFIGFLFSGSGSVTNVPVAAGDVIGFRVHSSDGGIGTLDLRITNFSAPVPAPGALAGMLTAAAFVALRRRREAPR